MFISCEGMEGSGKSTAARRIAAWLEGSGHAVCRAREPGGSRLGLELRAILLDARNNDMCPEAELFLYLADRAQHVAQVIGPALSEGKIVISDRYADSTIVYQGYGRNLGAERLFALNDMAVGGLWPDLTLLFDVETLVGLGRARERNRLEGKEAAEGRFEAESLDFHQRVRSGFLQWAAANPARFAVIDASGDPEQVFVAARTAVCRALRAKNIASGETVNGISQ